MPSGSSSELRVGQYIDWLAPGIRRSRRPPQWPPDVFAVAASLLQRSGAYTAIVRKRIATENWDEEIRSVSAEWRTMFNDSVPDKVAGWWALIKKKARLYIEDVVDDDDLTLALLQLVSVSDAASQGIGIISESEDADRLFETTWLDALDNSDNRTCCIEIPPDRVVVLPKVHKPRSGMTMRCLSHNVALYHPGEVIPQWINFPSFETHEGLRLLLLPWPLELTSECIYEANGTDIRMPAEFGFFTCDTRKDQRPILADVHKALAAAEKHGPIDAIIFPEGSLLGDEYIQISRATRKLVIGGAGTPARTGVPGRNEAAFAIPAGNIQLTWKQSKHHRWRIDQQQIQQYALNLSGDRDWWEDIEIAPRRIHFMSMNKWLTLTVLICEDLARLDPVADLVRSVGPTLVITLLLDGPQLTTRWPARYATVLAEDPGSSVLTLTSAGMARLSKPAVPPKKSEQSHTIIALWKDAKNQAVPIELKQGSVGVVLELERKFFKEWSADGREGETAYLLCTEKEPEQVRLPAAKGDK
jgi:hypothetical protein